jgi:hypothetical protein
MKTFNKLLKIKIMEQATPLMIVLQREVSRETLENIFITALEGGSNYWYYITDKTVKKIRKAVPNSVDSCLSTAIFKAVFDLGIDVEINDAENPDDVLGTLSLKTLGNRLHSLAEDRSYRYALIDELEENGDANSSDVIFQYLVMGEVVFG